MQKQEKIITKEKTGKPKKARDRCVIDSITEKNKRPVNMYNIDGKYIKTFSSVKEASEHFKCQSNVVAKACKSVNPTLRGFQLRYQINNNTDDIKPYIKINKGCIKVNQIDQITGDLIKTWNSVKEAANSVGSETSAMSRACKRGHNCKGFKWQYT